MVIYSTKSSEKVFHLPHCSIIRRIRKENRKQFRTPEEARMFGYRQCNCCSPVGMKLRKEQQAVNLFCQQNGVSCRLEDGQLHVRTPKGKWRIIIYGKAKKLFLYHKNALHKDSNIPSIIPGYHSQATCSNTILGYLRYIVRHDDFRERERKKAKRQTAKPRESHKRPRPYQRSTMNRNYSTGQLYSILDQLNLQEADHSNHITETM